MSFVWRRMPSPVISTISPASSFQVNLTSLTQLPEGIPDLGETVRVTYNGQMTSSIPAQVTADTVDIAVTIDELAGEIVEITGDGILLQTKDMQVLVNVDEGTGLRDGR